MRPATQADARRLFDWRNDPVTRAMSRNTDLVPWEAHLAWLTTVLEDAGRHLYVGLRDGTAIGTVRLDETATSAEISLALAPEARGQGLAAPLIRAGVALYRESSALPVLAEIRADNIASRRAFEAAGFVRIEGAGDPLHYRLA